MSGIGNGAGIGDSGDGRDRSREKRDRSETGGSEKGGRVNLVLAAAAAAQGENGGNLDAPPEQASGWTEAVEDWRAFLQASRAPKTVVCYMDRLGVLRRWAEAKGLTLAAFRGRNLTRYLADRVLAGIAETTRRHDAVVARSFFAWAAKEGHLPQNPLADYRVAKAAKPYVRKPNDDEIRRLILALDERWSPAKNPDARFVHAPGRLFYQRRNKAIVTGLIETAMRAGEMLALRLEDFSPEDRQVAVRKAKGKEPRLIPISDEWIGIVQAYLRKRPKCDSDFLFLTAYGGPVDASNFGNDFRGYLKYAGLSGFTLHGLRHYAITQLAKTNVWDASQIAGHKDLTTTYGYLHSSMEHVRDTHTAAAPLARLLTNARSEKARRKKLI